jgi:hypothetical protein
MIALFNDQQLLIAMKCIIFCVRNSHLFKYFVFTVLLDLRIELKFVLEAIGEQKSLFVTGGLDEARRYVVR